MPATEAQIAANRRNAALSTGPKSAEGKECSRRNGLKHGMSGAGVVVPDAEIEAVEARTAELLAEMAPITAMGRILVGQIATLSVRVETSFKREAASTSFRVRHAGEAFDDERYDEAERLLDAIGDDPRKALRKLMRMPEGVEALIEAWGELRSDLTREPRPLWTQAQRERAENLTGRKIDYAHGSTVNALSKAIWGDSSLLAVDEEDEEEDVTLDARKAKARSEMVAFIDERINALEAHYQTLDFDAIEHDRAEAPDRALFDPSKEATLARRYESEAMRNFHKAIRDFRIVEQEAQAQAEAEATRRPAGLGSSRAGSPPPRSMPASGPDRAVSDPVSTSNGFVNGSSRPVEAVGMDDPGSF